jgi:hypothetical protein
MVSICLKLRGCWPSDGSPAGQRWCPRLFRGYRFDPGASTFRMTGRRLIVAQEYTKRPVVPDQPKSQQYLPRHRADSCEKDLQQCLGVSDVVISAVPSPSYKVKTEWLKSGCICINVASEKNFEADVREKVGGVSKEA